MEERIAQLKAGSSPMSGDETIKKHEEELFNYRQLLAEKQAEIEANQPLVPGIVENRELKALTAAIREETQEKETV